MNLKKCSGGLRREIRGVHRVWQGWEGARLGEDDLQE